MNGYKTNILLYDGYCNLCNGMADFAARRDRKQIIRFVSLHSASGQEWLKKCNIPVDDYRSMVYIKEGKCYFIRSTAVLHILRDLGGLWQLGYYFIFLPVSWRDAVYNFVARTRYLIFGKSIKCMVNHADTPS